MKKVDASQAGEGNLEIFVVPELDEAGGGLPATVEPMGDAIFGVTFQPELQSDHLIYITFNDEPIPGNNNNNDNNNIPFHLIFFERTLYNDFRANLIFLRLNFLPLCQLYNKNYKL